METTPRRSSRLKKLKTTREEAGLIGQQTPQVHEAGNQQSRSNKSTSKLLELPAEIRLLIFSCVVATERPYMIGRCQEERAARSTAALETYTASAQPILRFRDEALPLWYSENRFWLIHNEFQPENEVPSPYRRFDAWISQTPQNMFDFMEHVSLCGYASWPNRMMITLDLKNRRLVNIRRYSTYGHELPLYHEARTDLTRQALASKADADGLAALQAVIAENDDIFRISQGYKTSPPGMMSIEPASGWEYDW